MSNVCTVCCCNSQIGICFAEENYWTANSCETNSILHVMTLAAIDATYAYMPLSVQAHSRAF